MDISEVTNSGKKELIQALASDGSFFDWGRGRLANVDRFLSNFHRPLQRRMLLTDPKDTLPDSGVIKIVATGDVFLIGDSRVDSTNDTKYNRITVLHSVNTNASDKVTYYNYNFTDPTTNDLNKVAEGDFYVAIEYVSSKDIREGDEAYQAKLVAFASLHTPFKRDGVFTLRGKSYKVVQPYYDSGFSCAHILQQDDDIELLTHRSVAFANYDLLSGSVVETFVNYYYPCSVDKSTTDGSEGTTLDIYVKYKNLLTKFNIGETVVVSLGEFKVQEVIKDTNTQGQYHLVCGR